MMYIYIMTRTQIYLSEELEAVLEERSKATGLSKSQLIRDAVRASYLQSRDSKRTLNALRASAGKWDRRVRGKDYVARIRRGRLSSLYESDE